MRSFSHYMTELFGGRVQKIAVDGGFTCPNRDGTVGRGGCTYCDNRAFVPSYCHRTDSVTEQLQAGKQFFASKGDVVGYLAYFQAFTGTHDDVSRLEARFEEALTVDGVLGLVIATRPDCLPGNVLDYIADLQRRAYVMVELGVETMHDRTLQLVNRCHYWATSADAIERLAACHIPVGVHLILGMPGETVADMELTVDAISALPVSMVKFHQMQVLKGTLLAQQVTARQVTVQRWTAQEYAAVCARLLRRLPSDMVVERVVAQSPSGMVLLPQWGLKPAEFQTILEKEIEQYN